MKTCNNNNNNTCFKVHPFLLQMPAQVFVWSIPVVYTATMQFE